MFDPQSDPLGIGVQQRAKDARWNNIFQGLNPTIGPLPDPKWEGYFQAASEASGGKPVKFGVTSDQATTNPADVGLDPTSTTPLSIQMLQPGYSSQLGSKMLVNKRSGLNPNGLDPTSQTT